MIATSDLRPTAGTKIRAACPTLNRRHPPGAAAVFRREGSMGARAYDIARRRRDEELEASDLFVDALVAAGHAPMRQCRGCISSGGRAAMSAPRPRELARRSAVLAMFSACVRTGVGPSILFEDAVNPLDRIESVGPTPEIDSTAQSLSHGAGSTCPNCVRPKPGPASAARTATPAKVLCRGGRLMGTIAWASFQGSAGSPWGACGGGAASERCSTCEPRFLGWRARHNRPMITRLTRRRAPALGREIFRLPRTIATRHAVWGRPGSARFFIMLNPSTRDSRLQNDPTVWSAAKRRARALASARSACSTSSPTAPPARANDAGRSPIRSGRGTTGDPWVAARGAESR